MTSAKGGRPASRRPLNVEFNRRTLIASAALLLGTIVIGVGAVALFSDDGSPSTATNTTVASDGALTPAPAIVPKPNSGTAPSNPGDRGGWEQLTLLGLIVAAMVGIGFAIARGGGGKAKANRQAWRDAASVPAPAPAAIGVAVNAAEPDSAEPAPDPSEAAEDPRSTARSDLPE